MSSVLPVALFTYARPDHLRQTLASLRANGVPLIYAFSDGPRTHEQEPAIAEVRTILHGIDWCDVRLCKTEENLGLGRSILTGVTELFKQHDALIVFEDDLVCAPGTYQYLVAAMNHYKDDERVMSVTGWTHPNVTPRDIGLKPYFDGRAECWVWGTWSRVWSGMDRDAMTLLGACESRGLDVYRYGADLPEMAKVEHRQNIWAVRFLYLHLLHGGLCFRPPYSLVEHIGFDAAATNAKDAGIWANPPLRSCPAIPEVWPEAIENPDCPHLWEKAYGYKPSALGNVVRVLKVSGLGLRRKVRRLLPLNVP